MDRRRRSSVEWLADEEAVPLCAVDKTWSPTASSESGDDHWVQLLLTGTSPSMDEYPSSSSSSETSQPSPPFGPSELPVHGAETSPPWSMPQQPAAEGSFVFPTWPLHQNTPAQFRSTGTPTFDSQDLYSPRCGLPPKVPLSHLAFPTLSHPDSQGPPIRVAPTHQHFPMHHQFKEEWPNWIPEDSYGTLPPMALRHTAAIPHDPELAWKAADKRRKNREAARRTREKIRMQQERLSQEKTRLEKEEKALLDQIFSLTRNIHMATSNVAMHHCNLAPSGNSHLDDISLESIFAMQ